MVKWLSIAYSAIIEPSATNFFSACLSITSTSCQPHELDACRLPQILALMNVELAVLMKSISII